MPLTKPPPNFDGTSSSRSKVRTRPHTASGSYSKPSSSDKLKSVAYSNTAAQKPPTPVTSPLGKPAQNEGPYWLSGLKSPERKRRPRTQGETTWERRAREFEEEEERRRALWLAERQAESGRPNGESATRDRETYMDGDGYIHNPLTRTDTREIPLAGKGHVLEKVRTLEENGRESGQRGGLLKPEPGRSSRRRAVESGLWEIGSKEPSELSNSSDSENDDDNDDVISFKNDAEEQERDREEFSPLTTPLLDSRLDFMNEVSFSNRGSVLLSGKKALEVKRERERTIARANRRSMQEIDSEEGAGTPSDSAARPSQPQLCSVDGTARSTLRSQSIPDYSGTPLPFAAPEASGEAEENNNAALTPQRHLSSPPSAEPLRSAPPTPEPTREAPSIPVPDIQPLPQRAQTQRVRNIGENPSPERPSSSPRPATPTQRPQSSPEQSRLGTSTNSLSAAIHDTMKIEPKVLLEKQLEARPRMPSQRHTLPRTPSIKTLSQEVEAESLKVRSMYEAGSADSSDWKNGALVPPSDQYVPRTSPVSENNEDVFSTSMANRSDSTLRPRPHTAHPSSSVKRDSVLRRENELAGGIEDWEGVPSERVDRYGFIVEPPSPSAGKVSSDMGPPRPPQRVSTALQLASETPRQGIFGRRPSNAAQSLRNGRTIDPKSSQVSLRTQGSVHRSPARTSRAIINRLPGMSERRVMSEAGDMLTGPPGLGPSQELSSAVLEARRKTEARRAEKWRKMAKVVRSSTPSKTTEKGGEAAEPGKGGGMHFTFNTSDPKLVSRVWKGIPDRWRATAWHSFLATSAKKHPDMASDEELGEAFRELVDCSSADDVQIDMDVPRTINSHIMFRSRYRGGQRLLFRVLHCLSLYFPETGYVQGMASLAATLLCYFEEEGAFVIAVRMWELRGLKKLYAPGFDGLMTALDEFKEDWLMKGNHDVNKQLDEMGVHPTAYGTRWYLTLFNYSVPFETQLRVWDLFMLLGDETPCPPGHRHTTLASTPHHGIGSRPSSAAGTSSPANTSGPSRNSHLSTSSTTNNNSSNPSSSSNTETTEQRLGFHGQLDILHAAGCAIVDGTRGIILESDFENVMKNLTSWVPVKDEGMFVRVVRAEWRRHGRK